MILRVADGAFNYVETILPSPPPTPSPEPSEPVSTPNDG
jgi:hypothetical protein